MHAFIIRFAVFSSAYKPKARRALGGDHGSVFAEFLSGGLGEGDDLQCMEVIGHDFLDHLWTTVWILAERILVRCEIINTTRCLADLR